VTLPAHCEDCGRLYGDEHGFPDLVLPDDVWAQIYPGGGGSGLLCPCCICARAASIGLVGVRAVFRSGPFAEELDPEVRRQRMFSLGRKPRWWR
jgi:hypothetical protein